MERTFDFEAGELLTFDKPYRWSSFDVVNKARIAIKHFCGKKIKVGHAGTLDPLATGLVLICTGKFTKKIDSLQNEDKEYCGIITIGATRPSHDKETDIDKTFDYGYVTDDDVIKISQQFVGEQQQVPPAFSAIKIEGVRAYRFARMNDKEIDEKLKPRTIKIYDFEIQNISLPEISFRIKCSKGTYIRSLVRDFGIQLGCGAYLEELRRTAVGNHRVEDAYDVLQFDEMLDDMRMNQNTNTKTTDD